MKRTNCKPVIAGLVLLACLSLRAPAAAHATVLAGPGSHVAAASAGLGWLASLWEGVKLLIVGGGNSGATVAKHGAASHPGAAQWGGAHIDDTSQINPDGHR